VRVIPGYQQAHFPRYEQRRFFSHAYTVSDRSDRMGYRMEGPAIACDIEGILSEGICLGAIQIPADGQPIVLLNDRQTIGGYPKIGSALSLDLAQMAQLQPGGTVYFTPITPHAAHNALHLAASFAARQPLMEAAA
jgi:allophanate hydrolase subunit 2